MTEISFYFIVTELFIFLRKELQSFNSFLTGDLTPGKKSLGDLKGTVTLSSSPRSQPRTPGQRPAFLQGTTRVITTWKNYTEWLRVCRFLSCGV